jgi:GT2 family glycosyltransferase
MDDRQNADEEEVWLASQFPPVNQGSMFVSVVVCTHSLDNLQNLKQAVDSLSTQTYQNMEIIIIIDGNDRLHNKVSEIYGGQGNIRFVALKENIGLSGARNAGVREARGDVIAFFDDDAFADEKWVENLVRIYKERNAIAVGGKVLPVWLKDRPDYMPEELDWLVGVTNKGFTKEKVAEVRNTYGPNMSFKREVFDEVGLFSERLGFAKRGVGYMQGEEAEFTLRMMTRFGKGVMYNSEAVVYHKIPPSKTKVKVLLRRAFYQGYSKALIKGGGRLPDTLATEKSYLSDLLFKFIPRRIKGIFSRGCSGEIKKLVLLVSVIVSVGSGFLYGYLKRV